MSNDNYPNQNEDKQNERQENSSRSNQQQGDNKAPWNRGFGQDENPKKRQFSRSARNQPNKEATTLSKVLLFLIIAVLISPFMLYWAVNATRQDTEVSTSSMENLSINRSMSESETSESESESESRSESSSEESVSSIEIAESVPEVVESVVETPTTPVETPEVTVPETPATGSYTIQAGDSWWSISVNFGINVYDLVQMNGATIDTPIYPGMQIVVH